MADKSLSDSHTLIDTHGDFLYRFALARVRNADVAEDLVQETFLAALQGTYRESGSTAERRWMIGIMKHKIVDHFRRISREPIQNPDLPDGQSGDDAFLADGHWKPDPSAMHRWPDKPDKLLDQRQFWASLSFCLDKLPPRAAQIFTLRDIDEVETEQICELLKITQTNLSVILHRTRKQLRDCLSSRYFGHAQESLSS